MLSGSCTSIAIALTEVPASPELDQLQLAPPFRLLKTPRLGRPGSPWDPLPTKSVMGFCGLIARALTVVAVSPEFDGFQLSPPFVVLNTPLGVPANTVPAF